MSNRAKQLFELLKIDPETTYDVVTSTGETVRGKLSTSESTPDFILVTRRNVWPSAIGAEYIVKVQQILS